jgi:surface polysaccharide O-acyltransferase-like enzyme
MNVKSTNHQQLADGQTERIQYIDALRGFTMILVVFYHVSQFCWHVCGKGISIQDYLAQVRMPMFFFISGFVLYKESVVWNGQQVLKFFKKKIPVQLISPFVFFLVYIFVREKPFVDTILSPDKAGYWFTFVLLEYYLFYAGIRFLIRNKWAHLVLLVLGLLFYNIWRPAIYGAIPLSETVKGALSIPLWQYFIFFVLGTLVKRHYAKVEKALDTPWLLTVCILFYFLANAFRSEITTGVTMVAFLLTISGMVILFGFFKKNQAAFSKERVLGRSLQYVGRRTLDVYLIHYLLVPRQMGKVITVFTDHPMPLIEATVSLLIALIIVAVCLLIGNIIRLSPWLAKWVFGAKPSFYT